MACFKKAEKDQEHHFSSVLVGNHGLCFEGTCIQLFTWKDYVVKHAILRAKRAFFDGLFFLIYLLDSVL